MSQEAELQKELLGLLKTQISGTDKRLEKLEALGAEGNGMLQRLVDIHEEEHKMKMADRQAKTDIEKAKIEGRSKVVSMLFTPAGFTAIGTALTALGGFVAHLLGWGKTDAP